MRHYRGLAVLAVFSVSLLAVAGFYGWSTWKNRADTISLTAHFDNTAGLYVTNRVAVLGMQVGSVTRVTPKDGFVEVEFTVSRDTKIPADAHAVTLQTAILADRSIELTPPYRGGPTLGNGDTIGLDRTKTPLDFTRTLATIDRLASSLQGDSAGNGPVRTLIDSAATMADGNGERIKSALSELSDALRLSADGGVHTKEQLTRVVTNLDSLMTAAAANETTLRQFGSTIRAVTQVLADEDLGSGTTGKQFNAVLIEFSDFLEKNRDAIRDLVKNGNTSLATFIDHQRDITELLDIAPMALDNVYNTIDPDTGAMRIHLLTDRVLFDSQSVKEVCNLMHLRQLGCSTGTLQDFGPDFGISYILDGLAAMGQK